MVGLRLSTSNINTDPIPESLAAKSTLTGIHTVSGSCIALPAKLLDTLRRRERLRLWGLGYRKGIVKAVGECFTLPET